MLDGQTPLVCGDKMGKLVEVLRYLSKPLRSDPLVSSPGGLFISQRRQPVGPLRLSTEPCQVLGMNRPRALTSLERLDEAARAMMRRLDELIGG